MSSQTLPQASLSSRARQGEPSAIAEILRKSLRPKGIGVQVSGHHGYLEIELEAAAVPEKPSTVALLRRGFERLQADNLYSITVYGRKSGSPTPAWSQTIPLKAIAVPVAAPATSATSATAPLIEAWLNQGLAPVSPHTPAPEALEEIQTVRLLRFQLGSQETALLSLADIKQVLTLAVGEILPVPQMPDCVWGVCNVRGEILWMVNLAAQLGLESGTDNGGNAATPTAVNAIVIQIEEQTLGLVVPAIFDIEVHNQTHIQSPAQGLLSHQLLPFVSGCLHDSRGIVLNASALLQDPQLQVHSLYT